MATGFVPARFQAEVDRAADAIAACFLRGLTACPWCAETAAADVLAGMITPEDLTVQLRDEALDLAADRMRAAGWPPGIVERFLEAVRAEAGL